MDYCSRLGERSMQLCRWQATIGPSSEASTSLVEALTAGIDRVLSITVDEKIGWS